MPISRTSQPWYPGRVVRSHPDDQGDLSGSPYYQPGTEPRDLDEAFANQAAGDDRGLTHPDPRGDTEPRFRSETPGDYYYRGFARDAEQATGNSRDPRNALTALPEELEPHWPVTLTPEQEDAAWKLTHSQTEGISGLHDRTSRTEGREAGDLYANSPQATEYINRLGDDLSDYWNHRYDVNRRNAARKTPTR